MSQRSVATAHWLHRLVRSLSGKADPIVIGVEPEPRVIACMNEEPNKLIVEVVNREEMLTNANGYADKRCRIVKQQPKAGGVRDRKGNSVTVVSNMYSPGMFEVRAGLSDEVSLGFRLLVSFGFLLEVSL